MAERSVASTDLVGCRVEYKWAHNTTAYGVVRAVYVTNSGFPMLLVQNDREHNLMRVSPEDAVVSRG